METINAIVALCTMFAEASFRNNCPTYLMICIKNNTKEGDVLKTKEKKLIECYVKMAGTK